MEKLRILQFGPTAYQGGVAVAIADLCLGLAQQGHDVGLLCNGGAVLERLKDANIQIFLRDSVGGTRGILKEVRPTARILSSFRPDIVHTHGRGPSLVSTLAGRYPDIFTLHNSFFTDRANLLDTGAIRRRLSPMGRKVIVLNDEAREYSKSELRLPNERIFSVLNGVDVERFVPADPMTRQVLRSRLGIEDEHILVLFVGRFHPQKQPEAIVKLAEALRTRGSDHIRFVMIGDGELKEPTARMAATLGLDDKIQMLSFRDPLTAYQAADLFVMPSLYEGFGLVTIEAMAVGCPVLRSRTGGFLETITDGETGYGCDVSIEDFVARAIAILDQPNDRARVAANGRARVLAEMSLSAHAKETTKVYAAAIAARRRRKF